MSQVPSAILEIKNISKRFPGVLALNHMSFSVKAGEIHALLGENGAGKSTLMKLIMGQFPPDQGEIRFQDENLVGCTPAMVLRKGISMVYQELNNLPHMTVAENIFVGREPLMKGSFLVDKRAMNQDAKALLEEFGQVIQPKTMMRHLSVAQAQVIEIIKAVSYDSKVVIMDEPSRLRCG